MIVFRIVVFVFFLLSLTEVFSVDIKVCKTCPVNSITKAVSIARHGDRVIIQKGHYRERNITVDKSISIIGEDFPVVDGESEGEILLIKAPKVVVKGLDIRNVGISFMEDRAGIKILNSNHCIIENNRLTNTLFGIYFSKSDSGIVRNNDLVAIPKSESESGNGIHMWYSRSMMITGNRISGHRDGIYLEFVEDSHINHNVSKEQVRYGLHFMFSHNNAYKHNTFSNNGAGVAVMYSKKIYMAYNTFSDNWSPVSYGLLLKDISNSRIEKNSFLRNTVAIFAEGTDRVDVTENNFNNNGWAIKILGNCEYNNVMFNNFVSNTFEVVTNSTTNGNLFESNYWSDYSGYDLNKDGIGDIPHRPVKLFTYLVEQIPPAIVLLRSLFIDLLNLAEKITPVITPETFMDEKPMMRAFVW